MAVTGTWPIRSPIASCAAFIASVAGLFTNKYHAPLKLTYPKVRHWIQLTTILYVKSLNKSIVDEKIDEREDEFEKICTFHLDKRENNAKTARFSVEYVFGDI